MRATNGLGRGACAFSKKLSATRGAASERGSWIRTAALSSCSRRTRASGRRQRRSLGKEGDVHGRDLRARGVTSVDEYIDLLSTPQKEIAAQLRALIRTYYPRLGEDIKGTCRCIRLARSRSSASKPSKCT